MAVGLRFVDNALASLNSVTYSVYSDNPLKILLEFDTVEECSVSGSATATKYPTETGIMATDYKYRNPDSVSMVGVISAGGLTGYGSVIARLGTWDRKTAIENIRKNCADLVAQMTLVTIQTRNSGLRRNMTMTGYTIDETADNMGALLISMQFEEVPLFNAAGQTVLNPSDSPTQDVGITQTQIIASDLKILR